MKPIKKLKKSYNKRDHILEINGQKYDLRFKTIQSILDRALLKHTISNDEFELLKIMFNQLKIDPKWFSKEQKKFIIKRLNEVQIYTTSIGT